MDIIVLRLLDHLWAALLALLSLVAARSSRRQKAVRLEQDDPPSLAPGEKRSAYLGSAVTLVFLGLASLGVWVSDGRSLGDFGFRSPQWTLSAVLVLAVLVLGLSWLTYRQFAANRIEAARERMRLDTFAPTTLAELRDYAGLAVSAGFGEEVAYRGFLLAYLIALFGSTNLGVGLAISLPAALFGFAHASQGKRGVLGAASWAIVWGFIVLVTGSLWPAILFHAAWDFFIGLVGLRLLRGVPAT